MVPLVPALLALLLAVPEGAPPAAAEAEAAPPDAAHRPRRYQVERIEIRGLVQTRDAEVRRRLLVAEGDVLDEDAVLLSRLRLLQLGWFSRVETRVERGSERGLVTLVFRVTERNTLLVSDLILGSTGPQPIYGGLGLTQQNFLGRGLGLSGAFVYGGSPAGHPGEPARFALRGAFFAPDLELPRLPRFVAGATALWLRGEELTCADPECDAYRGHYGDAPRIRYERIGGEGSLGIRPGPFERLFGGFRLERVHAATVAGVAAPGEPGPAPYVKPGSSLVAALTGTYELDTRDDFFFPREGFRGQAQITFASRVLGGDYEYSRYLIQLETAFSLLQKPLRLQIALAAVQGDAPFFDRLYAADFMYFAVGPALGRALELNFSTDSRYDAFLSMVGLEYAIPLWSHEGFFRRGYLATGARWVYSSAEPGGGRTGVSRWPLSADVALRLDTPVGVFNASIGYALDNVL